MRGSAARSVIRGNVAILGIVSLLNDTASEMIYPLLPLFLVQTLGAGPSAREGMTMTHRFEGERTLMRIFIGESDGCAEGAHSGKPLYEALLAMFRDQGFAGATVLRGIAGFGASARVHTDKILRLSLDLPIVVRWSIRSRRSLRSGRNWIG